MLDISYVIITFNDAARLPRAISSAALAATRAGMDYEVWVVDNGSADHTGAVLDSFDQALGSRLKVIRLSTNTGTTYSRNRALERASGKMICVMDSDAEILDAGLGDISRLLNDIPEVGIVAPRIIMPDGSTYNSVKLLPTLSDKLLKLPGIFLRRPTANHDWYPDFPFAGMRPVQSAISCAWFFDRELYERVGPLDEKIFYAPEDVDWCLRVWKAGRAVVYYPGLKVLHHTQQISHRRPLSRTSISHLKGLLYYLGKHGYWFSRRALEKRYIEPLASILASKLQRWESRS